jgi:ATP-dependent DNA helicase RecG
MNRDELLTMVTLGEDSRRQFKADVTNADSLAADLVAFSNSSGGLMLIGITDDGTAQGLNAGDVRRINQIITNAATQHMRSPISPTTENVPVSGRRVVIVLTVPEGLDKPYFDRHGVMWVKTGSDRRRIQSKEELRRLFQMTGQFHADELPTKAGIEALDKLRFRDYLRDAYKQDYPDSPADLTRLLQNLNLATDTGVLNLAGLLLFAEQPDRFMPQFTFKAIRFPGNSIHVTDFLDSEDFAGPLRKLFDGAMAFVMRNLHKVQAGRGVNAPGLPEIPPVVFEELLVNALVHRDYLVSAPIRLFIFDNRIEIISPGHLPDHLTVEKIRAGNSNIRNPILVSHVAKGILPYRGFASGIQRAIEAWPKIEFADDREGCLFTATVYRTGKVVSVKSSGKTTNRTLQLESRLESWLESAAKTVEPGSAGQVTGQVAGQVTGQVAREIALIVGGIKGDMTRSSLQKTLNLKGRANFEDRYLKPAIALGLIEMTIPEKPKSRLQKYRLTEAGRALLAGADSEEKE